MWICTLNKMFKRSFEYVFRIPYKRNLSKNCIINKDNSMQRNRDQNIMIDTSGGTRWNLI